MSQGKHYLLASYVDGPYWKSSLEILLFPTGCSFYRPFSYKKSWVGKTVEATRDDDPMYTGYVGMRFRDEKREGIRNYYIPLRRVDYVLIRDFARRLRKSTGADLTASGATRVSGSLNFKSKYAPTYPRVETVHVNPGRIVMRSDLEALGLVAPQENTISTPPPARASRSSGRRGWPDYQRCVQNAPPAHGEDRPDISRADFTFCLLAIDWGWSVEQTAARLMQESSKAQENGEAYTLRTAQNAAAAIERRGGLKR